MTQAQIVDAWERDGGMRVSRSTIAMAIKRADLEAAHPRPRYEDLLPWHVRDEHRNHIEARMLRLLGRQRNGLPIKDEEARWLKNWLESLQEANAVVTYDAETDEGFFWTNREPTDEDVIRRPSRRTMGRS